MKSLLLPVLLLMVVKATALATSADTTCSPSGSISLLHIARQKNYSERSYFRGSDTLELVQSVRYNPPVIDGGGDYNLYIKIKDPKQALKKRLLDIQKDTALVSVIWDLLSVWNWEYDPTTMKGNITLIRHTAHSIDVYFHLDVRHIRRDICYTYSGKRRFYKNSKTSFWRMIRTRKGD